MDFVKRTWAEIDLDRAAENYKNIKEAVGNTTKLCCVIKADGYGHGAVRLARLYQDLGADFFAVSNYDEGHELRESGITVPIMILGYTPVQYAERLYRDDISQTVYSLDYALKLSDEAVRAGVKCRIHIKLDTGMSRLGFMCQEFPRDDHSIAEIFEACSLSNLIPEGIFTHFAVSDEGGTGREFTKKQYGNFRLVTERLSSMGLCFPIRHCANSGAIEDYPMTYFDMVRAGIILYGTPPSDKISRRLTLRPVMSLKTVISYVKDLPAGATVSYGRTFKADRPMRIATVPIGYADGFLRAFSNGGYMLVNGRPARITGRICMDQTMLDVTDIENIMPGDEVTVFGDSPSAEELAAIAGTINYEVLCLVGKRVPRIYLKNGKITDVMYKL